MGFFALGLIPFVGILLEALAGEAYGPAVPAVQILLAARIVSAGFLGRDALAGLGIGKEQLIAKAIVVIPTLICFAVVASMEAILELPGCRW